MSAPASVINDAFFSKLGTQEGREKTAASTLNYVRDILREAAFSRQIIPTEGVTKNDCQRSVSHDTLVKIVDIEPNSKAMALTFRGQPKARFISAKRFQIGFHTIASEKFEKTEQELMAYEMPVTKVIENNTVKDIQAIEDLQFLLHVEACVQGYQLLGNGGTFTSGNAMNATNVNAGTAKQVSVIKGVMALSSGADNFVVHNMLKPDVVNIKKAMHRRKLKAEQLLLTEPDFDGVSNWTMQDVMGIASETATEGWKSNKITGLKFIRTIKVDILREGNVYCFTSPEFFGKFFVLNQTKFYIDKVMNVISWACWEDIGMGFGNVAAVVKLELYSGSVTPGQTTTGYADAIPKGEDDIFPVNNKVAEGHYYPQVSQF